MGDGEAGGPVETGRDPAVGLDGGAGDGKVTRTEVIGGTGERETGQVGPPEAPEAPLRRQEAQGLQGVEAPGDLVQVDTLQVQLVPKEVRFQFSAWDTETKYGGYRAYRRQTSTAAADFLHHLKTKFPFRIKAIQIDGGSEFKDQFEEACRKREITLFVNPPRCPEMNGGVERLNRTSREEFYEVEDLALVKPRRKPPKYYPPATHPWRHYSFGTGHP